MLRFAASDLNIRRDGKERVARKVFDTFLCGELSSTSCFRGCPQRHLKALVPYFVMEDAAAGEQLYMTGNPADKLLLKKQMKTTCEPWWDPGGVLRLRIN